MQTTDFKDPLPQHVAIIMDGNGRWATERGMSRVRGHVAGVQSVREITTECARLGLGSLTLYAFSVENWKRPSTEVRYLMRLLRVFLRRERKTLMKNGVRLRCIGRLDDLPAGALKELRRTEEMTRENTGLVLRLALSYGGRSEISDAMQAYGRDVQAGKVDPEKVDEESLRAYLYDPETPDPDFIIRTAGEMRLSNFLLWQLSYAELYVAQVCWPEFKKEALWKALAAFGERHRKFGLSPEQDGGRKTPKSAGSTTS